MAVVIDDEVWSAIGHPIRRRVLDRLLEGGPTTATALSAELPVTRQAVAKHLEVLEDARLVSAATVGRERRYGVVDDRLEHAVTQLTAVGTAWDARLQRIKRIAERIQGAQED